MQRNTVKSRVSCFKRTCFLLINLFDNRIVGAFSGQPLHTFTQDGMHKTGRDIAQRTQHKVAPVHKRVRHFQLRRVDYLPAIKNNIDIDGAGLVAVAATSAPKLGFNLQTMLQNNLRCKFCLYLNNLIQKPLAAMEPPWFRLIYF